MSPTFTGLVGAFFGIGAALMLGLAGPFVGIAIFGFVLVGWVISTCLHEYAHAIVAYRSGDRAVADAGYLTLDPLRYVDPFGSVIFPLLVILLGGFALPGAAVYVNPMAIRDPVRRSMMSLAGPMSNLAMLAVLAVLIALRDVIGGSSWLWAGLALLAFFQATAVVFNLLPIPGFDGWGVIEPFLPESVNRAIAPMRAFIPLVFIALLLAIPGLGRFIFEWSYSLATLAGVPQQDIFAGLQAFRFWENWA